MIETHHKPTFASRVIAPESVNTILRLQELGVLEGESTFEAVAETKYGLIQVYSTSSKDSVPLQSEKLRMILAAQAGILPVAGISSYEGMNAKSINMLRTLALNKMFEDLQEECRDFQPLPGEDELSAQYRYEGLHRNLLATQSQLRIASDSQPLPGPSEMDKLLCTI